MCYSRCFEVVLPGWNLQPAQQLCLLDLLHQGTCQLACNHILHETHVPHWCCVPAEEGSRESVDAGCRRLTAAWVREAKIKDPSIETCDFFEAHEKAGHEALLPPGEQNSPGMHAVYHPQQSRHDFDPVVMMWRGTPSQYLAAGMAPSASAHVSSAAAAVDTGGVHSPWAR